jgi:hypothetical protein
LPPPVDAGPSGNTTVSQTAAPAPIASTEAANGQANETAPAAPPPPKKPSGFFHGVLGL